MTAKKQGRPSDKMVGDEQVILDFARFWEAYPRKQAKSVALASWIQKRPPVDKVLRALEWQKRQSQWLKFNGDYVPYPGTYLNQARWEDEPMKVAALPTVPTSREWIDTVRANDVRKSWDIASDKPHEMAKDPVGPDDDI